MYCSTSDIFDTWNVCDASPIPALVILVMLETIVILEIVVILVMLQTLLIHLILGMLVIRVALTMHGILVILDAIDTLLHVILQKLAILMRVILTISEIHEHRHKPPE